MAKLGNTATRIIEYIWAHGESTEREVIDAIRPPGKSKRWGNSYFLVGRGNGRHSSLFRRGFIDTVGIDRRTGARLWDITPAALEVVLGPGFSDSIVTRDEVLIPPPPPEPSLRWDIAEDTLINESLRHLAAATPDPFLATATDDDGFPTDDEREDDDDSGYDPDDFDPPDPHYEEPGLADWVAARHFGK